MTMLDLANVKIPAHMQEQEHPALLAHKTDAGVHQRSSCMTTLRVSQPGERRSQQRRSAPNATSASPLSTSGSLPSSGCTTCTPTWTRGTISAAIRSTPHCRTDQRKRLESMSEELPDHKGRARPKLLVSIIYKGNKYDLGNGRALPSSIPRHKSEKHRNKNASPILPGKMLNTQRMWRALPFVHFFPPFFQ